jgi:hypothetical protein
VISIERGPVVHQSAGEADLHEGGDYLGVLMGLGYPTLSINVHSPVAATVIDPLGHFIGPNLNNIPGATYTSTGVIQIPAPVAGEYRILLNPYPSAGPDETQASRRRLSEVELYF